MADTYRSKLRFARISPKKARLVVDLVRGKSLTAAMNLLQIAPQRGATFVDKVLRSAWANAQQKDTAAEESEFFVSKATVDEGPIIYRGRAASMGRYIRIRKRTSHISIEISIQEPAE